MSDLWPMLKDKVRAGLMVRTHSGMVQPGEVFIALPGFRVDGTSFIAEAVARKAGFVIASAGHGNGTSGSTVFLEHPQPRQALGELAAAHHATDLACPVLIGVTGTNGKTTVAYLTEHLLASAGMRPGIIGTIGARWPGGASDLGMTTPDCWRLHRILAEMRDAGVSHVCMEVSSHALAQQRVAGLRFEVAILTNVTQDHLDYHGDMDTYFLAKSQLFAPGPTGPKHRVINADDEYGQRLLRQWGGLGYALNDAGASTGDHARVGKAGLLGEMLTCDRKGLRLRMTRQETRWTLRSSLVGRHNAANLLAVQGAGLSLGLKPDQMIALETFSGVPGRLERVPNNRNLDIFVDYAHTPDALENVLTALREVRFQRLIVVFGCGGDRDKAKRPLMGQTVCRHADVAVLTSDNPRHEDPDAILDDIAPGLTACAQVVREADRHKAIEHALGVMRPGDVLLVAGKGHETTQQIGDQYLQFHDPTVIRRLLGDDGDDAARNPTCEAALCA